MPDPRALADEAILHLDRLGAVILDDVGDGPSPRDLAAAAGAARDAVASLAVPALTQLTGLVAGVAASLAGGATEWNTSLGGTLMAAVDDLRHLASRTAQFSDEDSEHLHHRASELSKYVRVGAEEKADPSPAAQDDNADPSPAAQDDNADPSPAARDDKADPSPVAQDDNADPSPVAQDDSGPVTQDDTSVILSEAKQTVWEAPAKASPATDDRRIIPIDQLFYADAGPHIVSGGTSKAGAPTSDLLGRGIDALEALTARPIAPPAKIGAMEIVPVETLLYRGRAALQRAAVIREQIKSAGGAPAPAALDEMYDLIGLALKD